MLLGNPGILGQGYASVQLCNHPRMYLGGSCVTRESRDTQTRGMPMYCSIAIPGCPWDGPVLLGNPWILGQGVCPCITL